MNNAWNVAQFLLISDISSGPPTPAKTLRGKFGKSYFLVPSLKSILKLELSVDKFVYQPIIQDEEQFSLPYTSTRTVIDAATSNFFIAYQRHKDLCDGVCIRVCACVYACTVCMYGWM